MEYYQKYQKYKNKYLQLQSELTKKSLVGGFIKTNTKNPLKDENFAEHIKIENDFVTINKGKSSDIQKSIVEYYMPISHLYNQTNENFILINSNNYILINYKKNDDFILLKLTDDYQILNLSRPYPNIIYDNIEIENLDSPNKLHDIFESYFLYSNQIFLKLAKIKLPENEYFYYNKLRYILFKGLNEGQITLYHNSTDIFVLKLIFMNKLSYIISTLNNFDTILEGDTNNYDNIKRGDVISFDENKNNLMDYIYLIKYNKSFDDKKMAIRIIKSTIESDSIPNTIDKSDCLLILKIVNLVYDYVNSNLNIIYSYNYSVILNQYDYDNRKPKEIPENQKFKDLDKVVNKNYDLIKHSFIFELVNILYTLYKANKEFLPEYRISQYLLIDYFFGCTANKVKYLPINRREIIVSLRNDGIDNGTTVNFLELYNKYNLFAVKNKVFRYISQTQIKSFNFKTTYVDCGETTLLNMFNYFLIDTSGNITINDNWSERLKIFYKNWNNINKLSNEGTLQEMKNEWGCVIENIPELINNENTYYINEPFKVVQLKPNEGQYNLRPSIENITQISKILLNLEGNITIVDIIKSLKPDIENSQLILGSESGFEIIKYMDIKIRFSIGHSDFNINKSVTTIEYINNNKMNNIYNSFINPDTYNFVDQIDKDFILIFTKIDKKNVTKFKKWATLPKIFWEDYTSEDLGNILISSIEYVKILPLYLRLRIPVEYYCDQIDKNPSYYIYKFIPDQILNKIDINYFISKTRFRPNIFREMPDSILNRIPLFFYQNFLESDYNNIIYLNNSIIDKIPIEFFVSLVKNNSIQKFSKILKILPKSVKEKFTYDNLWNRYSVEDLCEIIDENIDNIDFNDFPEQTLNKIDINHLINNIKLKFNYNKMPDIITDKIPLSYYQNLLEAHIYHIKDMKESIAKRIPIDLILRELTKNYYNSFKDIYEILPKIIKERIPSDIYALVITTGKIGIEWYTPKEVLCKLPIKYIQRAFDNGLNMDFFPEELQKKIFTEELTLEEKLQIPLENYCYIIEFDKNLSRLEYIPDEILNKLDINLFIEKFKYSDNRKTIELFENLPELIRKKLPINFYTSNFNRTEKSIEYIKYVPKEILGNIPIQYLRKANTYKLINLDDLPEQLRSRVLSPY